MKDRRHYWEIENKSQMFHGDDTIITYPAVVLVIQFRHTSDLQDTEGRFHLDLLKRLGFEIDSLIEDKFLDYCEIRLSREIKNTKECTINPNLISAFPAEGLARAIEDYPIDTPGYSKPI